MDGQDRTMGEALDKPARAVHAEAGQRRRALHRPVLYSLGAAVVLLGANLVWSFVLAETPPALLPPAGEVMGGTAPFTFAVVGDSRGNTTVFEEILSRIRADGASLILHGGDIVRRAKPRQFDWVLHELAEENLAVPFCPVPGNHDIDEAVDDPGGRCRLYSRAFGPRRYWFAYANTLFVAFDTATKRCSADDLAWLDGTLARYRGGYDACFVYMHVPPVDPRPDRWREVQEGKEELARILKEHGVTAVFAIHIHSYVEVSVEGIPLFISGGAGARLEGPGDRYHYLLCTVEPGGSFAVRKIDVGDRTDADYPEYALRVKFPARGMLVTGVGLVLAAFAVSLFAGAGPAHKERRTPRT